MNDLSIKEHLQSEYPGAFKDWDGHEMSMRIRDRKDQDPVMLVVLYNKDEDPQAVKLHKAFLMIDSKEGEVIRLGGPELVAEFDEAYIPGYAGNAKT